MSLIVRNSLWFSRSDEPVVPSSIPHYDSSVGGIVQGVANGYIHLGCSSNLSILSELSNVSLGGYGVPNVVSVGSNSVHINGNVFVKGGLETISSTQLVVQDKTINVAYAVDGSVISDEYIDGAGVIVGRDHTASLKWRKSYGQSNGARWSLQGGGLHIERLFPDGMTVAYGFQINDDKQLEIVRHEFLGGVAGGDQKKILTIETPVTTTTPPTGLF